MTKTRPISKSVRAAGFTLLELMTALLLASIIVGMAIPSMRDFARNNRLSAGVNGLLRSFQIARNEAIKRQLNGTQSIIVCAAANPTAVAPTCGYAGTPFRGWIVFQDANGDWQFNGGDTLIEQHELIDPSVNVRSDQSSIVSYSLTGFANPFGPGGLAQTRAVVMCDVRGNQASGATDSTARAVTVEQTGRTRVTRVKANIDAAIAVDAGLTCP